MSDKLTLYNLNMHLRSYRESVVDSDNPRKHANVLSILYGSFTPYLLMRKMLLVCDRLGLYV